MLFTSITPGLGAADADLVKLKREVDHCIKNFPNTSNTDAGAEESLRCESVGNDLGFTSILPFEKLTFLNDEDNTAMFGIAQSIITQWRNTALGPKESTTEEKVRRIAAAKLGEPAVFDSVSPTLAVQALSSAGRIEAKPSVQLRIVISLMTLLSDRDIPATVRTEAITTLRILAGTRIPGGLPKSPDVEKAAEVALEVVDGPHRGEPIVLDLGPATVTPVKSNKLVPILAIAGTAVAAAGVLWYVFWRHPATQFSGVGPLRRKVETQLRRRRSRSR